MTTPAELYDRHRQAMAPILRLDHLPAEWNASITGYLVMAAAAAALYLDFPLDDAFDEAAPVFTPDLTPDQTPGAVAQPDRNPS